MQILLKDALEQLKKGGVHSLKVVTCDLKRETGGDILLLPKAKFALENEPKRKGKSSAGTAKSKPSGQQINIWDALNARIIKIHVRLIVEFDGKEVIW